MNPLNQVFDTWFHRGFKADKCKTLLNLATSRIKVLRNKRELQLKQMRRELAQLLQNGQETTARIRVEHIIREQNVMEAYDTLELFCELIVVRLPIIESQRECPLDLKEAVASVIFAAPRSSDIPELLEVQNMFGIKYGREFVAAATELRPDCRVNRLIIEKLSARAPSVKVKLHVMKEIAEENDVEWDASSAEIDFSKPPEDLLDGPNHFIGATQMPMTLPEEEESHFTPVDVTESKSSPQEEVSAFPFPHKGSPGTYAQSSDPFEEPKFVPFLVTPKNEKETSNRFYSPPRETAVSKNSGSIEDLSLERSHSRTRSEGSMNFQDIIEAAEAAAEAAEKAAQAARVAASLARSRISPKSSGQVNDMGMGMGMSMHHSPGTEDRRSSEFRSKASFEDVIDNKDSDFVLTSAKSEETQEFEEDKRKGESGPDDDLHTDAEDVQVDELVHVDKEGRREKSIFDTYGDDDYDNASTLYQPSSTKGENRFFEDTAPAGKDEFIGESRDGHEPFHDASTEMTPPQQPSRLPSLEDDPYYTYPNLFSKPTSGSNFSARS